MPPLQTRPKAALAGVGRHVILRPAVQKRYLELTEPTLEDQTVGPRARARGDGRRRAARPARARARRSGGTLRDANWKVTAVLADDLLIDVEPGDTTGRRARDRVRPRHDDRRRDAARPRDRAAARGALDPQRAAAVRRGRDLADLGDHDGRRRARRLRRHAHETLAAARGRGLRGGGRRSRPRSTRSSSPAT